MVFLLIVSSIHIVRDWFKWESRIVLLFSITNIKKIYIQKFCANFANSMRSWIVGQIVVSIVLSVYYALSFYLIKVPVAILIGIVFGFACFIPYLGDVFAFGGMFWILSSISATLFMIVGVILVSIVGHIFGSHILTPWIIGSHTGLHPIQIILGFLVYSKLFGVWGVILNIPISILINSIFKAIFYKEDDTDV
jgi:predicted PurR-regulated permease PerM